MVNKNRPLHIFKYLWAHTDESHPATTANILDYRGSSPLVFSSNV